MSSHLRDQPLFPLTVQWSSSEAEVFQDANDIECNLEDFDSENKRSSVSVKDSLGRPVRLKVEALEVIECSLK
jgi:hypothetical protein